MTTHLTVTPMTVTVSAFGETREVDANIFTWTNDNGERVCDDRVDTRPVFAGRCRSSQKLWKVSAHIAPSKSDPTVYEVTRFDTVIINHSGYITGWWNEQRYERVKSQHNGANK